MKLFQKIFPSLVITTVASLAAFSLRADPVFCCTGSATADTGYTANTDASTAGGWTGSSTYASTAAGDTQTSGGRFCQGGAVADTKPWFQLVFPAVANAGGTYILYGTRGSDASVNTDAIMNISAVANCTVSASTTTFFQKNQATLNGWKAICNVTLNAGQTVPTIKFTYHSGTLTASTRLVSQGYKLEAVTPCSLTATVDIDDTTGPFDNTTTSVGVKNISASATKVTVYKYNGTSSTQLGANTYAGGSTPSSASVSVSSLAKGDIIFATQTVSGQEGCKKEQGITGVSYTAGSGAPNKMRFCIGLRNTSTAAAPLGFNGGGTGTIYLLGANGGGAVSQSSAPTGIPAKNIITAGRGWQTLSFINGTDPCYNFTAGSAASSVPGNAGAGGSSWAVLEGLYIVPDDPTDTGEYKVYIDNIKNGSAVLQDFEGGTVNSGLTFSQPSFSGTTSPNLLGSAGGNIIPNLAVVTTSNPDVGSKCDFLNWQFNATASTVWLRLTTSGANGTPNPSVDVSQPVTIRVLVLPAGVSSAALNISQPANKTITVAAADSVTITATDSSGGSSALAYQWKKNGVSINAGNAGDLTGYNSATLSFTSPVSADAGSYSCAVTDTVTGTGAGTYTSECNQFVVSANKANQTISFGSLPNKNYGDPPFNVSATASSGLSVSFSLDDTPPASILGNTITLTGPGTVSVRAKQLGNADYNAATDVVQSFTVFALNPPNVSSNVAPHLSAKISVAPLLAACSNPQSYPLSLSTGSSSSQGGAVSSDANYIYYSPPAGNLASDTIAYSVSNGHGGLASAAITINFIAPGGLAQSIAYAAGGVSVTFAGIPGQGYDVQRADDSNFTVNPVTLLTTNAPAAGIFSITDPSPPNPTGFYRTKQN
ncbi:MAG: hypothetical protein C5B50_14565 [Verrucomicrobia bacterium]|nr:MAG: hypothetical protein C5B50_14565 [Verrucomicrobiota bacterium]